MTENNSAGDRVLRYRHLHDKQIGDRVTIWRWVRAGKFPAPRDILGRPGWFESEIEAWLHSRPVASVAPRPAA